MPDLSGRELLSEWRQAMDAVLASAAAAGSGAVPRQLLEPIQRQLELVQELIERERSVQQQLTSRLLAPLDAVFDLLEESGATLRSQAEALESAGRALEETARLVRTEAELFERTIRVLREPTERTKTAAGLERRVSKPAARQTRRRRPTKG